MEPLIDRSTLIPLTREELVRDLAFALMECKPRPPRETPDQSDLRRELWAKRLVKYLELCGVVCFRRPSDRPHQPNNMRTFREL